MQARSLLFVVILAFFGVNGFSIKAEADPAPTHQDADACEADVHRLCEKFLPDEKQVATCLVERRADLSKACAEVLARPDPEREPTPSDPYSADPDPGGTGSEMPAPK